MRKITLPPVLFIVVLLLYITFIGVYVLYVPYTTVYSDNGYYDISNAPYNEKLAVALNGSWDYLGELSDDCIKELPKAISKNKGNNVYTSKVKLPSTDDNYCIYIPRLSSDYQLVINGTIIYQNGIFNGKVSYINNANSYVFQADNDELIIELHTHALPSLLYLSNPICIGSPDGISMLFLNYAIIDIMLITTMICSCIYFFILSLFERNKGYNYLALLSLLMSLRASISNNVVLGFVAPFIPNDAVSFLSFILPPLLVLAILYFIDSIFNEVIATAARRACAILCLIYICLAPFLNYAYPEAFIILFVIIITYTAIILIHTGYKAMLLNRLGSNTYIVSGFIMLIATLLEICCSPYDIKFNHSLNFGFILFLMLQTNSFLIHLRESYLQEKRLTKSYDEILSTARSEKNNFISSHLKPHFIFNTLNIISGYALFDSSKAKKICDALTVYMKQLFEHNNISKLNLLSNEINLIKAFGFIESERFPNITIRYDIDENLEDLEVPSLMLQPLLENAINHGIRKRPARIPGYVDISIHEKNQYIYFEIRDNGVGMDEEAIKKALTKPNDDLYHGLFHLQLRLGELYYEELSVESEPEKYTKISFKIPR